MSPEKVLGILNSSDFDQIQSLAQDLFETYSNEKISSLVNCFDEIRLKVLTLSENNPQQFFKPQWNHILLKIQNAKYGKCVCESIGNIYDAIPEKEEYQSLIEIFSKQSSNKVGVEKYLCLCKSCGAKYTVSVDHGNQWEFTKWYKNR